MKHREVGSTLIEVLVAILITATGVLGAAAMQLNAVKFNQVSTSRSAAVFLANDIADRLRANRAAALAGSYDLSMDADAPKGSAIHQIDLQEWLLEISRRLPSGDASVARSDNQFTITLQWDEGRLAETREPAEEGEEQDNNQTFVFVTEL